MNAERLLAHYERIADAPDANARLRRFILDLAVRGKLVPQNSSDEPASELLKRIAKEKARLVKADEIRDKPSLPNVANTDMPFPIPLAWEWVRFANIVDFSAGRTPSRNDMSFWNTGDHAWVSISDMEDGQVLTTTKETVSDKARERVFGSEPESPGTILMSFKLTIGKIARLGLPAFHNEAIISIRPHLAELDAYLFKILPQFAQQGDTKGAIKGATLNRDSISNILFPLPPLAEQHRIVAKVDELMALCDRVETARVSREAVRDRLAAASLARLNAPDPETFQADARFALAALPALTTRPDQVKQLRQTILNLAVRGKLVPQNPDDEPASELLNRIAKEIPLSKAGTPTAEPPAYDAPRGWVWTRLGELVAHSDAGWSPKTQDHPRSGSEWGVLKVSAVSWDRFRAWENKQVLPGTEPRLQAEVKQGDFLISRANTAELIARAVLVDEPPIKLMMSDKIVRLHLSADCCHRYVWIVNNYADFAREHYVRHASGVSPSMKNVSRDVILSLPFPLPPLAEQHRIVAKVDALMVLCDRLEASLTAAAATRRRLLDALLAEALAPAKDRELEAAE